ncbi:TAXI family TRAP transporter solute-binding subunit [Alphaproteobacteria bacterium]|jgi:TRAP transporter TAXI family solute receptor|nr:TAXI family TRAP transporter solute-binding subunit [Alphaproteobacteria bacterium]
MLKTFKTMLGATFGLALFTAPAMSEVITIGSGSQGSLGFNTGQSIAKIVNQELGITARTQPLTGYLPLINNGELDFGFANAVEVGFAGTGTGTYAGKQNSKLRLVGTMFPLKTGLMVVADTGIETVADLKAKSSGLRIASEYKGSTIIPYYIEGGLANGGMVYDDFVKVPVSNFVKGIFALGDGLVDVSLVSLNSGAGKKSNAQLRDRGGLKYVSLDNSPEGQAKFKQFMPAAKIISMKANPNVPGLQKDVNIMEIPWMMITNEDVSDELVYKITKAIVEYNDKLGASFGAFKNAKAVAMAPANAMSYHPGALRYYKEAGIKVGD